MKKSLIIISFIALVLNAGGQVNKFGLPVIRNYPNQLTGGNEQNWCIVKDKWGNVYFGNQDHGVIRYDGTKWIHISVPHNPRIYSLEADSSGIVYVGAAFEFGYVQPGIKGNPEYVSLSSRLESKSEIICITNITVSDGKVYFIGPDFIYVYNKNEDTLSKIDLKEYGFKEALRLVRINGRIILSENFKGLFELKDTRVEQLPGGSFFSNKICTVIMPYEGTAILVATFYDGIYLYDYESGTVNSRFIDPKINQKLKEVMVYAGARIGNDRFAIGTTQEQGILVFDKSGALIQRIDNTNSALQDITIYSMYCDASENSELWIASQGFISKAYLNLPVTQFTEKQGIDAGLNSICTMKGSIYLSTDAGVLKSYITDKNTISFRGVNGAGVQVFPLIRYRNGGIEFLIAGSIDGLLQISDNGVVKIADRLKNLPEGQTGMYRSKRLLQSSSDPSLVYVGNDAGGIRIIRYDGKDWTYVRSIKNIPGQIYGLLEDHDGSTLWFITEDQNGLYNVKGNDTIPVKYGPEKGVRNVDVNSIHYIGDNIYITTSSGIYRYDRPSDIFVPDNSITGGFSESKNSTWLFTNSSGELWYSGSDTRYFEKIFRKSGDLVTTSGGFLQIMPNVPLMDIMSSDGKIYLLKSKYLYVVDPEVLKPDSATVKPYFVKITAGSDSVVIDGTFFISGEDGRRVPVHSDPSKEIPVFGYDMNQMTFECTTPHYTEELLTEYSYKLDGFDKEWSKPEGISYGNTMEAQYFRKEYSNLPFGTYTFRIRTSTVDGLPGGELSYRFIILKPWYATIWALVGFILVTFGIIYLIIKAYTRKLKNENLRLEGIVAERTAVVVKQKEELESSIHYASRIQMALLPSETILSENIRNYFILFKPRDIVSGDFYWMTKKEERLYIVAADCTGHGVPGAFMSLLGMSFLDEIIDKDKTLRADQILKQLRLHVTDSLKQVGNEDEAKDGMDIALLVVDFGKAKIEFSGAYNPCYRVKKISREEASRIVQDEGGEGMMSNGKYLLETIYASKMPIGISSKMNEDFVLHEWSLEKGISYYLFSDGYLDQFGGPDGRKFMKKNFKRLILDIQDYPMSKQKELLDNNLKQWMGNAPQIDDILVMGIRTE